MSENKLSRSLWLKATAGFYLALVLNYGVGKQKMSEGRYALTIQKGKMLDVSRCAYLVIGWYRSGDSAPGACLLEEKLLKASIRSN